MDSIATSVRINGDAKRILDQLSERTLQSRAQVIELALRQLEEHLFWSEVHAAYAIPEAPELRAERKLWDQTTADGFAPRRKSRRK